MTISVDTMTRDQRRSVAIEYFRRLDGGRDMLDLFADTAEIYFPKWGVARGLDEIQRMWSEVGVLYREIRHFTEYFNFVIGEHQLFVEGLSDGIAGDGTPWTGGQTHAGRWCDAMEIRDGKIERLYIYLDPDYAGADTTRYPWLH
jgi:ketosteroid isomerase-like protein